MPPAPKKKEFNPSIVQAMQEPITATVFKVVGNSQNPVALPLVPGQTVAGAGLTRDDVLKLATTDLIKQTAGAAGHGDGSGVYIVQIVDAAGTQDRFELIWQAHIQPGWTAPALGQGYSQWPPPAAPQPQLQPQPGFGYAAPNPYQYPGMYSPPATGSPWPGQTWGGYATPQYHGSYAPQPPWAWSTPPATMPASSEAQQLRDQIAAQERAWLEDKYLAERQADATRHAQELQALREEIRRATEAAKPTGPSPEMVAMQTQIAQLQSELRAAREDATRARDEGARRQEMAQLQQGLQTQIAQVAQSVAALSAAPKSDPMIPLIQEQARQSAETAKAIAQSSRDTTDLIMKTMMNPMQAMEMAKTMAQKPAELISSFEGVMGMYQNAFQMMQQAAGSGGNPIADTISAGMQQIGDAVKSIFKSKGAEASAQAQIADANARVVQAQAQVIASTNGRPVGFGGVPPVVQLPASAPQQTQASGEIVTPAQPAQEVQTAPEGASAPSAEDLKLFGPEMAQEIVKFRLHVAGRLVDLKTGEAVPQPTAEEAAEIVQQAVGIAASVAKQRGVTLAEAIPAFAWYTPKDMARLTSAMLPDAPQAFVDALTAELVAALTGQEREDDDEDDDDDDDDDEEPIAASPSA